MLTDSQSKANARVVLYEDPSDIRGYGGLPVMIDHVVMTQILKDAEEDIREKDESYKAVADHERSNSQLVGRLFGSLERQGFTFNSFYSRSEKERFTRLRSNHRP